MIADFIDVALRLLAATAAGIAIGANRDLRGKPTGFRTLGLVALGPALVTIAATRFAPIALLGVLLGILTGVGFLGTGVIMRDVKSGEIQGLTTAATVWLTAAIGIVCGLGDWMLFFPGVAIALILLVLGLPFERRLRQHAGHPEIEHSEVLLRNSSIRPGRIVGRVARTKPSADTPRLEQSPYGRFLLPRCPLQTFENGGNCALNGRTRIVGSRGWRHEGCRPLVFGHQRAALTPPVFSATAASARFNRQEFIGRELGVSHWLTVDQSRINQFAQCTDDDQWIHVDVERVGPSRSPRPHLRCS